MRPTTLPTKPNGHLSVYGKPIVENIFFDHITSRVHRNQQLSLYTNYMLGYTLYTYHIETATSKSCWCLAEKLE